MDYDHLVFIISQWHPTLNYGLKIGDWNCGYNSTINRFWICKEQMKEGGCGCAHIWETSIRNRIIGKMGCPYCCFSAKKFCIHDSLAHKRPEVAIQWHNDKNGLLKPTDVQEHCGKIVWWLCPNKFDCGCSHEWQTSIDKRTARYRTGCPYCCVPAQKFCIHNSLAHKRPDIAAQWHPTKNGDLKPTDFQEHSEQNIWWLCMNSTCGCIHEWKTMIRTRTGIDGSGCPYCAKGQLLFCVHQSLAVLRPEIAAQWHPTKNGELKPTDVQEHSHQKIWWLCTNNNTCECIHEWQTTVYSRSHGIGCPYCCIPAQKICIHNSLAHKRPDIANEWHPTKNNINPTSVAEHAHQIVWWMCSKINDCGCIHEWEAFIYSRTGKNESGCPYCSISTKKFCIHQSLAHINPELSKEWDYNKNGELTPEKVQPNSHVKIFWLCSKGHSWSNYVYNRNLNKNGCPHCKHKTEAILYEYLNSLNEYNITSQYITEWCKNPKTNRYLPFDFCIEKYKIIIELDGRQHFENVTNWQVCERTIKTDLYKMSQAFLNGYSVVRLLQDDVFNNKYNWKSILLTVIKLMIMFTRIRKCVCYRAICMNNEYHKHAIRYNFDADDLAELIDDFINDDNIDKADDDDTDIDDDIGTENNTDNIDTTNTNIPCADNIIGTQ